MTTSKHPLTTKQQHIISRPEATLTGHWLRGYPREHLVGDAGGLHRGGDAGAARHGLRAAGWPPPEVGLYASIVPPLVLGFTGQ